MKCPLCERLIWSYKNANEEFINDINRATERFRWEKSFENKTVHSQKPIFNKAMFNICGNFIPNKVITFHDKHKYVCIYLCNDK